MRALSTFDEQPFADSLTLANYPLAHPPLPPSLAADPNSAGLAPVYGTTGSKTQLSPELTEIAAFLDTQLSPELTEQSITLPDYEVPFANYPLLVASTIDPNLGGLAPGGTAAGSEAQLSAELAELAELAAFLEQSAIVPVSEAPFADLTNLANFPLADPLPLLAPNSTSFDHLSLLSTATEPNLAGLVPNYGAEIGSEAKLSPDQAELANIKEQSIALLPLINPLLPLSYATIPDFACSASNYGNEAISEAQLAELAAFLERSIPVSDAPFSDSLNLANLPLAGSLPLASATDTNTAGPAPNYGSEALHSPDLATFLEQLVQGDVASFAALSESSLSVMPSDSPVVQLSAKKRQKRAEEPLHPSVYARASTKFASKRKLEDLKGKTMPDPTFLRRKKLRPVEPSSPTPSFILLSTPPSTLITLAAPLPPRADLTEDSEFIFPTTPTFSSPSTPFTPITPCTPLPPPTDLAEDSFSMFPTTPGSPTFSTPDTPITPGTFPLSANLTNDSLSMFPTTPGTPTFSTPSTPITPGTFIVAWYPHLFHSSHSFDPNHA
eukprot:Phypoly_transcript_01983.p1 GENE.Phypoly_transcript_01983~~Phypoly_transcript_01983.p1  ORF type:complete len:554 (+),score=123.02 Phypoly_transcript_01983:277-1938(+)